MNDLPKLLDVAHAAVQRGADIVRTHRRTTLTPKGDRDYTSNVDYEVERELRVMLGEATPKIAFLGEEEGSDTRAVNGLYWALDPIDGTVNFANEIPLCAVSLALIREEQPVIGVIKLPYLDRTYMAAQGYGATCDRTPISVGRPATLADAVVSIGDYAVGVDARAKNRDRLAITHALAETALRVRMLGSAAIDLAWIAQGSIGATIMLSNKPWDTAAGVILAREAGADLKDLDGTNHTMRSVATIATAPSVTDEVLALIADAIAGD